MHHSDRHISPDHKQWYAVYTRFKCEKQVCRWLSSRLVETYLPLLQVKRQYTRKVKTVELPLISCYVFVRIARPQYLEVLQCPNVVGFVRFEGNLAPIPEREMDILRRIVGEQLPTNAEPLQLEVGQQVEIVGGNLTGLSGVLSGRKGKKNFVVTLETLGYQLRIEADPALLQPLPASRRNRGY